MKTQATALALLCVTSALAADGRLALPEPALRRLFRENALRWVPGLATATRDRP